jgi:branched-chain amino acid transport system permease protein
VAVIVGIPALRIKGLFLAVATLGFTQAASSYFLNYTHFGWIPTQNQRIPRLALFGRLSVDSEARFYYFSLAVLLATMYAVRGLRRSRVGRVLIAVRENERGVQAYGINATQAKLTAFAISGFMAAVGGVLLVHLQSALYPGGIDPVSSLKAFVMVVIGGLGSMTGIFAGAIYLQGLSWSHGLFPRQVRPLLDLLGSGLGLIIVLMFLPEGVGSVVFKARDNLLKRLADKRGIVVPSLVADTLVTPEMDEAEIEEPSLGELVPASAPIVAGEVEGAPIGLAEPLPPKPKPRSRSKAGVGK